MVSKHNPWDSVDCHFCNGKGCYCEGHLGIHELECVSCDICESTGQMTMDQLDQMARDYQADAAWERRD